MIWGLRTIAGNRRRNLLRLHLAQHNPALEGLLVSYAAARGLREAAKDLAIIVRDFRREADEIEAAIKDRGGR
jgi:hypothetical protein